LGAYAHEDLPFELLVDALKPERSMAYSPLFQVMFSYQNTPREELKLAGIEASPFSIETRTSMFDLTLLAWERPDGVLLTLEYSTDLFDRATIQRLFQHFEVLLAGAMADPEARISQLPLLDDSERRRVLAEWNSPDASYPSGQCTHEVFEEQARKTPDAVALTFDGAALSYGELNQRANQLAHHLRKLGVGPDSRVAICVERRFEMIVAVLGVLKAGGGYVPLDPAYPEDRLRYMLKDSAPVALLTEPNLVGRFGELGEMPVLDLADGSVWKDQPDTNPDAASVGVAPHHLAYVIYTSGSTGAPKGVMVEHANVTRLLAATDAWFHFDRNDVWTLFHSFDFSVWEIWGALLYGGRLVIVPQDVARSTEEFYKLICHEKVTVLNQTPSAFRQLIAVQAESRAAHELRYVIFGGEALEVASLKPWYEQDRNHRTQLVNMYGITETTVHVTYRPLEQADTERRGGSPIGCRIPDLRIYILDQHRDPVPVGVVGELYVGGAGVARGYLNRPELTAERFLTDPFVSGAAAARMYKTGDLGRWLADGSIEFFGRNDFQVKIRGFRVELGEIEARLAEQPGVREAAVIAREDTPGDKRLVAYYTGDENDAAPRAELFRTNLSVKLPDYMVPAAYVWMKSLPLTQNGKLDRKALPAPEAGAYKAAREFVSPRTPFEARLTRIWEDVLKVSPIGMRDNYFDLGGYSLLAVKLFSEIKKAFGLDLPLATLYSAPTIELCAKVLSENGESALWSSLVPIRRNGSKPPFHLVSGVGGGVLVFRDLAINLDSDQPVYALQPKPLVENETHPTSIEEMAAHYVKEIQAAQPAGPYYIGGYSLGGFIAYEMAQQLTDAGHKIAFLGLFDANAPLRIFKSKTSLIPERTLGSRLDRRVEVLRSKNKTQNTNLQSHHLDKGKIGAAERVAAGGANDTGGQPGIRGDELHWPPVFGRGYALSIHRAARK
jgi:amino acid adenylation domain-containing protein